MSSIQAPRGTFDVLPADAARRAVLERHAERILGAAGYRPHRDPDASRRPSCSRAGWGRPPTSSRRRCTRFDDGGGRSLTLRPEGTAPVCRAYLEHGMHKLPQPVKLWYLSSFFRAEAPQRGPLPPVLAGRRRGDRLRRPRDRRRADPAAGRAARDGGRQGAAAADLEPGHAGDPRRVPRGADRLPARARGRPVARGRGADRPQPDARLRRQRPPHAARRCATRRRCSIVWLPTTPSTSRASGSCSTTPELAYELDPTLVRGLDYYTRTLYEFTSDALGAQSAVGGGGRYDGLIEQLGGPPTPGFGLGGRGRADAARRRRATDARRRSSTCSSRCAVPDGRAGDGVQARQRGPPGRPECPAGAGRPLAQGPAQAGRPARRALRCDHRRPRRDLSEEHGVRRAADRVEPAGGHPGDPAREPAAHEPCAAPRPTRYRDAWAGELDATRAGTEARVSGWVHRRRDHGGLIFIDLRERSGIVQLVLQPGDRPPSPRRGARAALRGRHHRGRAGQPPRAGERQPQPRHRRDRDRRLRHRDPRRRRDAAVPARRGRRRGREPAPSPPLARPAPRPDAGRARAAPPRHRRRSARSWTTATSWRSRRRS